MIYKNAELYNVVELIPSEQGVGLLPVRIPSALRLKLNDPAQNSAVQSAGCELRFILAGDAAEVTLVTTVPERLKHHSSCDRDISGRIPNWLAANRSGTYHPAHRQTGE